MLLSKTRRDTNLKILLYMYVAVYAWFLVWTIIDGVRGKEPWWDVTADLILLPLGGIGMFLFLNSVANPSLKSAWKVISILMVIGQIIVNVIARHRMLAGKTDFDPEGLSEWGILFTDLISVLLLAPMLVMNVMFAFR